MNQAHYEQARTSAIAFDLSTFSKVKITGKDRAGFLQNFTTNDVVKPGVGSGCETFLTTAQARIVAWLRVAIRPNDLYANMEPCLASKVVSHLEKFIISEDVQLLDCSETDFLWLVTGPKLSHILQSLGISIDDWLQWQNGEVMCDGVSLSMQRCDFLGMPGAFLWGERAHAVAASSKLMMSLLPTDDPLWNMLRVEAGTPAYGIDFDETCLPQEVNRTDQAISFTKGCYIGQETVARIRAYGHVNRKLIRLKLTEDVQKPGSWSGAVLKANDKDVGMLKTVAYSPQAKSWLAFGLVRKEHLEPGTMLIATSPKNGLTMPVVTTT